MHICGAPSRRPARPHAGPHARTHARTPHYKPMPSARHTSVRTPTRRGGRQRGAQPRSPQTPTSQSPRSKRSRLSPPLAVPMTPASMAARETYNLLPEVTEPYTDADMVLLESILVRAERGWAAAQSKRPQAKKQREPMALLHVLRAYESVLSERGVSADDDTYYYKFLLKLSLDKRADWFQKFQEEKQVNASRLAAQSPRGRSVMAGALDEWRAVAGVEGSGRTIAQAPEGAVAAAAGVVASPGIQFSDVDTNGDGVITQQEWESAIRHQQQQPQRRSSAVPATSGSKLMLVSPPRQRLSGSPPRSGGSPPLRVTATAEDLTVAAVVNGRSPDSEPSAIIHDISEWIGMEQREWDRAHSPEQEATTPTQNAAAAADSLIIQRSSPLKRSTPLPLPTLGDDRDTPAARSSSGLGLDELFNSPVHIYPQFHHMAECFRRWSGRTFAMRSVRLDQARQLELYIVALDRWALRISAKVFGAWRLHSRRKRERLQRALLHWAKKTWRWCFVHWMMVNRDVRALQRRVKPTAISVLAALMLRPLRGADGSFVTLSIMDAVSPAFRRTEVRKPTNRKQLEAAQRKLRRWYTAHLLQGWKARVAWSAAQRNKAIMHCLRRDAVLPFNSWIAWTRPRVEKKRYYASIWAEGFVQRHFRHWLMSHTYKMAMSDIVDTAVANRAGRRLLSIVKAWCDAVRKGRLVRSKQTNSSTRRNFELQRHVFERMSAFTSLMLCKKRAILVITHRRQSLGFRGWLAYCQVLRLGHVAAVTLFAKHQKTWGSRVFKAARAAVGTIRRQKLRQVKILVKRGEQVGLPAIHRLRTAIPQWDSLKRVHLRLAERLINWFRTARYLGLWLKYMAARQQMAEWMHRVQLFRIRGDWVYGRKVLHEWTSRAAVLAEKSRKATVALQHWTAVNCGPAMRNWIAYTRRMSTRRSAVVAAMERWGCGISSITCYDDARSRIADSHRTRRLRKSLDALLAHCRDAIRNKARLRLVPVPVSFNGRLREERVLISELGAPEPQTPGVYQCTPAKRLPYDAEIGENFETVQLPVTVRGVIDWLILATAFYTRRRMVRYWQTWARRVDMKRLVVIQMQMATTHMYLERPFVKWQKRWEWHARLHDCYETIQASTAAFVMRSHMTQWCNRYGQSDGMKMMWFNRDIKVKRLGFEYWTRYCELKVIQRRAHDAANALRGKRQFIVVIQQWCDFVTRQRVYREKLGIALYHARPRQLRRFWYGFVASTRRRADLRRLYTAAMQQNQKGRKLATLVVWRRWSKDHIALQEIKRRANNFFMQGKLALWQKWFGNRLVKTSKQFRALAFWLPKAKLANFKLWLSIVHEQRRLRQLVYTLWKRSATVLKRRTLSAWHMSVEVLYHRGLMLMKIAFARWLIRTKLMLKLHCFTETRQISTIARCMKRWHRVAVQSSQAMVMCDTILMRKARALLCIWRKRWIVQVALHSFAQKIASRDVLAKFHSFRKAVAHVKFRCKQIQVVSTKLLKCWASTNLTILFQSWNHLAQLRTLCCKLQLNTCESILRWVLLPWRDYTRSQKQLKLSAHKCIIRIMHKGMSQALTQWAEYTDKSIRVKQFALGMLTNSLASRFSQWRAAASESAVIRSRMLTIMCTHRESVLRAHFVQWSVLSRMLRKMSVLLGRHQDMSTRKALTRWIHWLANKKQQRECTKYLEKELSLRPVCAEVAMHWFSQWKLVGYRLPFDFWLKQAKLAKIHAAAISLGWVRHVTGTLTQVFQGWRVVWLMNKKCHDMIGRFRNLAVKLCFDVWADAVTARVEKEIKKRDALVQWEGFTTRVALAVWRCQVRLCQEILFMLHHRAFRYVAKAYAEWSIRTVVWANRRHHDLRARCQWAVTFLRGTFATWAESVTVIKIARSCLEMHLGHMASVRRRQYLRVWCRTTQRRLELRSMVARHWRHSQIIRYLTGWLLVVVGRIELRRKMLSNLLNLRRRVLCAWRRVTVWKLERVELCSRSEQLQQSVFKHLMSSAIEFELYLKRATPTLREYVKHWRLALLSEVTYRRVMCVLGPRRVNKFVMAWADVVEATRKLRSLMRAFVMRGIAKCWNTWLAYHRKLQYVGQQFAKAVVHARRYLLLLAFRAFVDKFRKAVRMKNFAAAALQNTQRWSYLLVWDSLQQYYFYRMRKKANKLVADNYQRRLYIAKWRLGSVLVKLTFDKDLRDVELTDEIRNMVQNGQRQAARQVAILRNVSTRWRYRTYLAAMATWKDTVKSITGARQIMWKMKMLNVEDRFRRWKSLWSAIQMGHNLFERRNAGRQAEVFHTWLWLYAHIKVILAGKQRRAFYAWLHRARAVALYREVLIDKCTLEDKVIHRRVSMQSRQIKRVWRMWARYCHRRAGCKRALRNGLVILSSYRFFYHWLKFVAMKKHKRRGYTIIELAGRGRWLLFEILHSWMQLRSATVHTRVALTVFRNQTSSLKKKARLEQWKLFTKFRHEVSHHQALVVSHKRHSMITMRVLISRQRVAAFWRKRQTAYTDWKATRRSVVPPHISMSRLPGSPTPSPRDQPPGITLPGVSRFLLTERTNEVLTRRLRDQFESMKMSELYKKAETALPTADVEAADAAERPRQALITALLQHSEELLRGQAVPVISDVPWVQQEYEAKMLEFRNTQEREFEEVVQAMREADAMLLLNLYCSKEMNRRMQLPFWSWRVYTTLFGSGRMVVHKHASLLNWGSIKIAALDRERGSVFLHLLSQVLRTWQIHVSGTVLTRHITPHKVRVRGERMRFVIPAGLFGAQRVVLHSWHRIIKSTLCYRQSAELLSRKLQLREQKLILLYGLCAWVKSHKLYVVIRSMDLQYRMRLLMAAWRLLHGQACKSRANDAKAGRHFDRCLMRRALQAWDIWQRCVNAAQSVLKPQLPVDLPSVPQSAELERTSPGTSVGLNNHQPLLLGQYGSRGWSGTPGVPSRMLGQRSRASTLASPATSARSLSRRSRSRTMQFETSSPTAREPQFATKTPHQPPADMRPPPQSTLASPRRRSFRRLISSDDENEYTREELAPGTWVLGGAVHSGALSHDE